MESNIDITRLKSAEIIDDPGRIAKILFDADEQVKENSAREAVNPSTLIECDADGRAKVRKEITAAVDTSTIPSVEELRRLAEAVKVEWEDGFEERVIPYWASDERVDRHGDIVRQRWDFRSFETNPVVPYSHNWDMPPIGNSIRWEVARRTDNDYDGPGLHLLNLFAPATVWEFADTIYRLVKSGFLKASSVGFYPNIVIDVKDDKEREELGLGRYGYIFDNNELVEHSPTTIPANPGALSLLRNAKKAGMLKAHDVLAIRDMERDKIKRGPGDVTKWRERDAVWRSVWGSLYPEVKLAEHKELDVPITLESTDSVLAELREDMKALSAKIDGIAETNSAILEAVDDLAVERELTEESPSGGDTPESDLTSEHMEEVAARLEKAVANLGD